MSKPEQIPIRRHERFDELNKRIKTLETDAKILVGYIWQKRWNEQGYAGLAPRYAGGRPSKLREEQKEQAAPRATQRARRLDNA